MTSPRLLVVDDDRLILSTLGGGLRALGYQVDTVDDPQRAVSLCEQIVFDLALLDMAMPGMSGIELARELRRLEGPPVVFLSAYSDPGLVGGAVAEGALGYLVKPLDIVQIAPTLSAALARAREVEALLANKQQLRESLDSNRVISTAVGLLMERRRVDRQHAFELLRGHARRQRRRVLEVAEELLNAAEVLDLSSREP